MWWCNEQAWEAACHVTQKAGLEIVTALSHLDHIQDVFQGIIVGVFVLSRMFQFQDIYSEREACCAESLRFEMMLACGDFKTNAAFHHETRNLLSAL